MHGLCGPPEGFAAHIHLCSNTSSGKVKTHLKGTRKTPLHQVLSAWDLGGPAGENNMAIFLWNLIMATFIQPHARSFHIFQMHLFTFYGKSLAGKLEGQFWRLSVSALKITTAEKISERLTKLFWGLREMAEVRGFLSQLSFLYCEQ